MLRLCLFDIQRFLDLLLRAFSFAFCISSVTIAVIRPLLAVVVRRYLAAERRVRHAVWNEV